MGFAHAADPFKIADARDVEAERETHCCVYSVPLLVYGYDLLELCVRDVVILIGVSEWIIRVACVVFMDFVGRCVVVLFVVD